jgi:hypothetical protein
MSQNSHLELERVAWLTEYNGVGDNLRLFRQRTAPRDRDYRQRRMSGRARALKASTVIRLKLPPAISVGFPVHETIQALHGGDQRKAGTAKQVLRDSNCS